MKASIRVLLLLCAIVVSSAEAQLKDPVQYRGALHVPAIRGGGAWSSQYDVQIPIIYQGDSRELTGFNSRLATDTSRLKVKSVRSGIFHNNADSVVLEYSLLPLSVTKFPRLNATIHIRTLPDAIKGEDDGADILQLNHGDTLVIFTVAKKVLRDFKPDFIPISWIWLECDDNQLIAPGHRSVSSSVTDYQYNHCIQKLHEPDITDTTQSFPTRRGAPAACMSPSSCAHKNARELEFKSGGIYPYTPGIRRVGDANNNFVPFEINDALEVARFITQGNPWQSKKYRHMGNPDMNCDRYVGDISDFALLLRAATGDIMHEFYVADSLAPDTITFSQDKDILSIDGTAFATLLIFDSEFSVELIRDGPQIETGTIDGNTHILVYHLSQNKDTLFCIPAGKLAKTWGVLIDAYAVNYDGYKLQTKISH